MAKKYMMPPARVGFAAWYPDASFYPHSPMPAIITDVSPGSVNLTVWAMDNRGGMPKDGVRHVSDPEVATMAGYSMGLWDYSQDTKDLYAHDAKIDALSETVETLIKAFGGMPVGG